MKRSFKGKFLSSHPKKITVPYQPSKNMNFPINHHSYFSFPYHPLSSIRLAIVCNLPLKQIKHDHSTSLQTEHLDFRHGTFSRARTSISPQIHPGMAIDTFPRCAGGASRRAAGEQGSRHTYSTGDGESVEHHACSCRIGFVMEHNTIMHFANSYAIMVL